MQAKQRGLIYNFAKYDLPFQKTNNASKYLECVNTLNTAANHADDVKTEILFTRTVWGRPTFHNFTPIRSHS